MIAHGAHLSRQVRVTGNDQATFPRRDLLVGIERKHAGIPKHPTCLP